MIQVAPDFEAMPATAPLGVSAPEDSQIRDETKELQKLAEQMTQLSADEFSASDLKRMAENQAAGSLNGGSCVASGYVYLAQFVAHDVVSSKAAPSSAAKRSPALDLDAVYGQVLRLLTSATTSNRELLDQIYDASSGKMWLSGDGGRNHDGWDLPRDPSGAALVVDPRIDQNLLASQLHVQFIRLHNHFVELLGPELSPDDAFHQARRQLILHYQEVVLNDLLRTLIDERVWRHVIELGGETLPVKHWLDMPLMFGNAAFRFGHSMVRASYAINRALSLRVEEIFTMPGRNNDLGVMLPRDRVVDWSFFFDMGGPFNRAEPISPAVPRVFRMVPPPVKPPVPVDEVKIAVRDLQASKGLPCGQACVEYLRTKHTVLADAIGLKGVLNAEQLNPHLSPKKKENPSARPWDGLDGSKLSKRIPLWYYVLAEAYHEHGGNRLGPLGSLIVAESLRAAIHMSSPSIFSLQRPRLLTASGSSLRMVDLLRAVNQEKPPKRRATVVAINVAKAAVARNVAVSPEYSSFPMPERTANDKASPASVVQKFVGRFQATGDWSRAGDDRSKDTYYPREGLELEIYMVPIRGRPEQAYAKVKMPDSPARLALEAAVYRAEGETLVAEDIELEPGMLVTEILTMNERREMLHTLRFSDGTNGSWICWDPNAGKNN